jgi:hypothetical protein
MLYYICEKLISHVQNLCPLNLSDMTSKFRTVAIFIIVYVQTVTHTQCVAMFSVRGCTIFHVPVSNCSFIIAMKAKVKEK